jgi:hypothetical protein
LRCVELDSDGITEAGAKWHLKRIPGRSPTSAAALGRIAEFATHEAPDDAERIEKIRKKKNVCCGVSFQLMIADGLMMFHNGS